MENPFPFDTNVCRVVFGSRTCLASVLDLRCTCKWFKEHIFSPQYMERWKKQQQQLLIGVHLEEANLYWGEYAAIITTNIDMIVNRFMCDVLPPQVRLSVVSKRAEKRFIFRHTSFKNDGCFCLYVNFYNETSLCETFVQKRDVRLWRMVAHWRHYMCEHLYLCNSK